MFQFPDGRPDQAPCDVYWHSAGFPDIGSVVTSARSRVNRFPGAQGSGIYLINCPSKIRDPSGKQLVQEYVSAPFLMKDQLKFDFRVYGVIRSINPLSIYVSREGMARFCTERYKKPTSSNFDNLYSHLTNYSLNKVNDAYVHSNTLHDQVTGSKRLLSTVFSQMAACGVRPKKLWHDVKLIIVKTVLAMLPELMIQYERTFSGKEGPQCFQIVGFDIMVREDGSPILLEVNACPSLTIDHGGPDGDSRQKSVVDEVIKIPLVRDTLLLVTGQLQDGLVCTPATGAFRSTDDLASTKRKAHLSEVSDKIFPNRYGRQAASLLFLDKVVYIFMQYSSAHGAMHVPLSGIKRFVKDCGYEDLFMTGELEKKVSDICQYYVGDSHNEKGLFFHGFLSFMIYVAERVFPAEPSLQKQLQKLFDAVTNALRNKGVRSKRLRREEFETKSGR
ncbi:Tubulin-tyrosine ligase family protein [Ancylostoma caninum]|uniref:Tubulin-tyrosine ligase family protein n=1 Tax=Ancylostoma caninum TaxID=29170 RepID=A0A368FHP3_ANCCA|nr:Tubulin-tyrosine ligase family protein [Ancylostoma caninum]